MPDMPKQVKDKEIIRLAEGIFGVEGWKPARQLEKLKKEHSAINSAECAPIYLRLQHSNGAFLEMRPHGDHKSVEFMLHIPDNSRTDFALLRGELQHYSDTQRATIGNHLSMMHEDRPTLKSVHVLPEAMCI